uniref:Putative isoform a marinus n=1 Tax=Lutzomyia longipalpis TaxID=7200 RepID=A0A240SXP8_LUTLO
MMSAINFTCLLWLLGQSFNEGDMVTFSYGAIWVSATLQSVVKALTGIYYKEDYFECFNAAEELTRRGFDESVKDSVRKILAETIKLTKIIVSAQGLIFHATAFLLAFYAISTDRIYPLMYHIPFISPAGNHTFQWIGILLDLYTVLGGDFLFITMALQFRGELAIISELLGSATGATGSKFLHQVHQMHIDALRRLRTFHRIYYHLTFLQMISSLLLICLTTFMIRFHDVQVWAYAVLLCGLMQIFFLCLIGDILFEKASLISTALYLTKWYEMKLEDQGRLLIMIAMAQKPYGIKAAGLVDVSFFTFIEVCTFADSFFFFFRKAFAAF